MKLITKEIMKKLEANKRLPADKRKPVLKLFNPYGNQTWLFSEIEPDGQGSYTLFGLCDLAMGSPELGYQSLAEIESLMFLGKPMIERDLWWEPEHTLMKYYDKAYIAGAIEC